MRSHGPLALATLVTAIAMLTWSCTRLPTAPVASPDPANPAFLRVPGGAATPFGSGTGTVNFASKDIDGAKGGSFGFGNFKLVVPPGAFAGKATLTITIPDPAVMRCDLSISPPEANRFAVPVQLVSDCSTAAVLDPAGLSTLWYDPSRAVWVPVPGSSVSVTAKSITTPLLHFSEYGIVDGKAGW